MMAGVDDLGRRLGEVGGKMEGGHSGDVQRSSSISDVRQNSQSVDVLAYSAHLSSKARDIVRDDER